MDTKSLCLGALSIGEASGYEIKKMFEEGAFRHFYDAGYGSIYPALKKLLDEGLVTCVEMEQEGRPAKKVYSLTEAGRDALKVSLKQAPARDRVRSDSLVMMFFAHLIEPGHRAAVLDAYIDYYRISIDCIENTACDDHPFGHQFVSGLGYAICQAAIDYLEENKEFLLSGENSKDQLKETKKSKVAAAAIDHAAGGVA